MILFKQQRDQRIAIQKQAMQADAFLRLSRERTQCKRFLQADFPLDFNFKKISGGTRGIFSVQTRLRLLYLSQAQIMSISYYAYYAYAFMYIKCCIILNTCMNLRTVFTTYATNYLGTKQMLVSFTSLFKSSSSNIKTRMLLYYCY